MSIDIENFVKALTTGSGIDEEDIRASVDAYLKGEDYTEVGNGNSVMVIDVYATLGTYLTLQAEQSKSNSGTS
jgi:hypothetical protein